MSESTINRDNFISIQGWMRTELKLTGNDLLVYAIIYGFSQTKNQKYTGSLQYLADWCGATKQGVLKNLKNLLELGLIIKEENIVNNVKFVEYRSTEFNTPLNIVEYPIKHSLTNNIENNIEIKDSNNTILKNSTAEPPITKSQIITKRNLPNINDDFSEKEFKEEKPKSKRKNLYEKCLAEIDNFTEGDDVDLKAALKTYLEIRLKMKDKPILGVGQWKGLLKTLNTLTGDKVAIVERATERGWGSFFELKDFSYQKKPNSKPDYSIFGETKEMKNVLPNEVEGGEFSGHIF